MDGLSEVAPREMNFDGLVGPTHNYAGLSFGNVASRTNSGETSQPREAALQGLRKMAFVRDLGIPQGVFPPQARPRLDVLRALGFQGDDASLIAAAAKEPPLLAAVYSASAMWAANAATVTASADATDGRVHFTAANLASTFHRSLEPDETAHMLARIFDGPAFAHHAPLPPVMAFGDEGAANHTRFIDEDGAGWSWFVYGRRAFAGGALPTKFPARQTREASESIARQHGITRALYSQQAPRAIDAGAFHNDVVAVGHGATLLWHERAFEGLDHLQAKVPGLRSWCVTESELSLEDAVASYLFNSQLLTTSDGLVLIAPVECSESPAAGRVIARLTSEGAIARAHFLDLRQSMRNGGGPACLRLRVPLTEAEREGVLAGCVFTEETEAALIAWVERHYRETLAPSELADPALGREVRAGLDALTQILHLGDDFYAFQRA